MNNNYRMPVLVIDYHVYSFNTPHHARSFMICPMAYSGDATEYFWQHVGEQWNMKLIQRIEIISVNEAFVVPKEGK